MNVRVLLALPVATLAFFASPKAVDPYGVCEGVGTKMGGQPGTFECVNHTCDPGCAQGGASGSSGGGVVCFCNYIGPHPDCCRLVFFPSSGTFGKQGKCTSAGCGTSGKCLAAILVGDPEGDPPTPNVYFVNCSGGVGVGD